MQQPNRTEKLLIELNGKFDLLIKVMGMQVGTDKSLTERARLLKMAGLDTQTIADALNISAGTVSVLTSNLRAKMPWRDRT